ncbi:inositol monophosphatase family protein [Corynebacterium cystitidis]|uniref:inositol monophosphatase family protein n=1 Tax=Corynebacterium cystitidis TaxID=35757 RepID=UPI00211EEAD9|nr:inositol monophosphatase [Corynebacterium cystitidis]
MVDTRTLLTVADDIVRQASEMFVDGVGAAPSLYKKDGDFATEMDISIEKFIRDELAKESAIPVYGEEQGGRFDPEACWIIDPIDGTTNYASGNPNCSILVSLVIQNEPRIAVTAMPLFSNHLSTRDNEPVYLNGEQLPELDDENGRGGLIGLGSVGSPDSAKFPIEFRLKLMGWLTATNLRPRITGSVGVDLALVASGAFQAAMSFSPNMWDNTAGVLLARNAGAVVTDGVGRPWTPTSPGAIVGTRAAHATVMSTIDTILKL